MMRKLILVGDASVLQTKNSVLKNIEGQKYNDCESNAYSKTELPAVKNSERVSFSKHQHEILV